ncbi:trafficking protein particle complex subunit 10 [Toxorhynchites rutilus septentrionalis]|uniref:trafficking protein particle complex subunit 10 n=1 Tax=Toxorhynchites rutilus septentrionalis TaxID=329112 RepID=UPI00247AE2E6|nr:trafficking protein particle complex subunit 10 [Toxorhynchites rutilus septentrionalis]
MNCKPILTYSGDSRLFKSLEPHITSALPLDTAEWRRSYGRPVKNVRVEASFKPFDSAVLEKYRDGKWSIIDHPVIHIFVTECNDVETYRASVKEEIDQWLKVLNNYNVADWMILLVETLDVKKSKNILPRTTVLDKIRLDFASKNGDRCLSILNPSKFEMKATESFRCLLQRIRHLMLAGYNKNIVKYEELIRSNRENRIQENWNFIDYFLLQEQLAFVLEMLGQHSEALVQYDELDALFSQFILNSVYGEKQKWLSIFDQPLYAFHGISLNATKMEETRKKIINQSVNLLEFRSYLFERQCLLLDASGTPWEIAERLLPFLFSTLREIEALKLETPEGALACWEFICALEVLNLCDKVQESKDMHKCSQYSAAIWNLAKDKLYSLGKQCGLLPGCTPTSEQLHTVVHLSAGMGDSVPETESSTLLETEALRRTAHSPVRKPKKCATDSLKEALGSNQAFTKLYLELNELAISTYKHVSRLRSARLVGLDLGNFYITLNEPQKAVVFFTDLLRELKTENWHHLASQTLLELASCYKKMNDYVNYVKTCSAISCCLDLEMLVRTFYFDEFLKSLKTKEISNNGVPSVIAVLEEHFKIVDINVANTFVIQDDMVSVVLRIESNFPREILCQQLLLSYEMDPKSSADSVPSQVATTEPLGLLPITLHLDYKQDRTLSCASVACDNKAKQPVRRTSSTRRKISPTQRSDFTNRVACENLLMQPGMNVLELKTKAKRVGSWSFKQLSVQVDSIEFLSESIPPGVPSFEIITKASSAVLNFMNLIAGVEQPVKLIVSGGSFRFPKDAQIVLKCSKNLRMRILANDNGQQTAFDRELLVNLHNFQSFEERTIELEALCDLPGRREEKPMEHKVTLQVPWSRNEIQIPLHFLPALTASCRLHSSGSKKFLQVILKGVSEHKLILRNAHMVCAAEGVTIIDINPKSQNEITMSKALSISYLYEIQVEALKAERELPVIHVDYKMEFADVSMPENKRYYIPYVVTFDVMDYTTLFTICAKVEPSELCRVNSVCHLNLRITKVHENPFTDLMYEVLADQNMWVVVGRTAGVISMEDVESHSITLDVLPLSAGFLPLPNIRLSKYISTSKSKADVHPRLQPFPPGQIYNSTKSMQIHVLASSNTDA